MPELGLGNRLNSESSMSSGISRGTSDSYSVNFPGVDDYIQVPSTLGSVITPNSSWSITAWINMGSGGAGDDAIISTGNSTTRFFIRVTNSNGRIRVSSDGGSVTKLYTTGTISADTWTNVTFVYTHDDASELVYYKNGSSVGSASNFDMVKTPGVDNAQIGIRANTADDYIGKMSTLGVYSKALSASEVQNIYDTKGTSLNTPGNLELWYRMGDGTENGLGDTIYDMSTNSNNGTLEGDAVIQEGAPS